MTFYAHIGVIVTPNTKDSATVQIAATVRHRPAEGGGVEAAFDFAPDAAERGRDLDDAVSRLLGRHLPAGMAERCVTGVRVTPQEFGALCDFRDRGRSEPGSARLARAQGREEFHLWRYHAGTSPSRHDSFCENLAGAAIDAVSPSQHDLFCQDCLQLALAPAGEAPASAPPPARPRRGTKAEASRR